MESPPTTFLVRVSRQRYVEDADSDRLYTDVEWTGRAVLVLGSEGKGLRQRVAKTCDELTECGTTGEAP